MIIDNEKNNIKSNETFKVSLKQINLNKPN